MFYWVTKFWARSTAPCNMSKPKQCLFSNLFYIDELSSPSPCSEIVQQSGREQLQLRLRSKLAWRALVRATQRHTRLLVLCMFLHQGLKSVCVLGGWVGSRCRVRGGGDGRRPAFMGARLEGTNLPHVSLRNACVRFKVFSLVTVVTLRCVFRKGRHPIARPTQLAYTQP